MMDYENIEEKIKIFLQSKEFGVVGASNDKNKYGNKVFRCYVQHQKKVYPINESVAQIENIACIKSLKDLSQQVKSISIVTKPIVTEKIILDAIAAGIKNIWMQPGASSNKAVSMCQEHNINVIHDGPCILVVLGFNDDNYNINN